MSSSLSPLLELTRLMRSQALGWHRVGCEPGPEHYALHTVCEQATFFFSEAVSSSFKWK